MPKLRRLNVSEVKLDTKNANKGTKRGREFIEGSLKKYGLGRSILLDKDGSVIAGNKTLEAFKKSGGKEIIVVGSNGNQLIAVQREDLKLESKIGRSLAIADNRSSELDLEWDAEILSTLDLKMDDLFKDSELRKILGDLAPEIEAPEPHLDKAEKLRKKWKTARGQIWEIGEHRLMCGDCTESSVQANIALMVTDPPYGVDYGSLVASRKNQKKGGWDDISGDALSDDDLKALLISAFSKCIAPIAFVWHPAGARRFIFWDALIECGWTPAQEIVWVKNSLVFGRADYQWQHEPCIYAKREGAPRQSDRTQTTIWSVNKPHDSKHPTMKPVEIFAIPIRNHTQEGDKVFDPFCGSGTLICAAQVLNRICYGMEIEPKYVAVALERLSEMGLKPELTNRV